VTIKQVNTNPAHAAKIDHKALPRTGFGKSFPDCCVRKIEKIINTTIPPTYTTIWTAATNSIWSQKYNPAIPVRENNSQMAERNILLEVTASRALPRINTDRI
jgi:hypothetical protein